MSMGQSGKLEETNWSLDMNTFMVGFLPIGMPELEHHHLSFVNVVYLPTQVAITTVPLNLFYLSSHENALIFSSFFLKRWQEDM